MSTDHRENEIEPEKVELRPEYGELSDTPVDEKPGDDRHHLRPPLPRGPFRPVTDLGEETIVEETDGGADHPKR